MLDFIRAQQRLHPLLEIVRKLEPIAGKELDSIILIGIVRGRNHDPGVRAKTSGQERDARRRHRTNEQDVHAHRTNSRGQGRLQHVA